MDNEKFNREEIGRILKIAAELNHKEQQNEEGLSREELQKLALEVGIDPHHIETAIQQLREQKFEPETHSLVEENFSFRDTLMLSGTIDDGLWEDIVTEIRRINGGIGKTSKLGNTYEWEQRKKNVGYLQVSITPKGDHSRIRLNASYRYYANFLGFIGGVIGFTLFSVLGDGISSIHGFEMLVAGLGAVVGWGSTRFYIKSWMRRKRRMLRSLSNRLTELFTNRSTHDMTTESKLEPQITVEAPKKAAEGSDNTSRPLRST